MLKEKFRQFKKIIKRKSFIGSFIFAGALWIYSSLNGDYVTYIKIPLSVKLPETKAIENALPSTISVEVRGTGWQLFNLIFFNTAAKCSVDLTAEPMPDNTFELTRSEFIKSLQFMMNVQAIEIQPSKISIKTGSIADVILPVRPELKLQMRDGFVRVGNYRVEPDSLIVKGNEKNIKRLFSIPTKTIELNDVHSGQSLMTQISDTLRNIIETDINTVRVSFDVQQKCSMIIPAVSVKIRGGNLATGQKLIPDFVKVVVTGGVEAMTQLSPESIKATIDITDLINDSTGYIIPKITCPENYKILNIQPPYLRFIKKSGIMKEFTLSAGEKGK